MITKEQFINLINQHKEYSKYVDRFIEYTKIDLINSEFFEAFFRLFDNVVEICFNEAAIEDIFWWIYEKDYGTREEIKCWDKDGNELPYNTIEDLWEQVKDNRI